MKVKVSYSQDAFDAAAKYVSEHNPYFLGQNEYVRECIKDSLNKLASTFPLCYYIGTMGYMVVCDDIDEETNNIHVDILVRPTFIHDTYSQFDVEVLDKEMAHG